MAQILRGARSNVLKPQAAEPTPTTTARAAAGSAAAGLGPCLAYLAVDFGRPQAWFPFLEPLRLGMLAAIWGLIAVIRHKSRPIPRPIFYMLGLAAVMAWNVPFARNNRWAFWGFQDFIILVVGFVLPLAILPRTLAAVRLLLTFYFFLHIPMAIHGMLHGGYGTGGWIGDQNDLALALNVAIGVGLYLMLETKSTLRKILIAVTIGVLIAGVVATESRGGFVGLASLGLFLLLAGPHRIRVLFAMLLAVAGLFLFAPPTYWDEVRSIETAGEPGDTGEQRMYLWGLAVDMFKDHPVFGVGTRNYGIEAPFYEDVIRSDVGGYHVWGRVCHSLYFTLIAEQGIVGSLFFVLTLLWSTRTFWKLRRRAKRVLDQSSRTTMLLATGLYSGLFAYLITGAFLTVLYYPVMWVMVAFLASLDAVTEKPAEVAA